MIASYDCRLFVFGFKRTEKAATQRNIEAAGTVNKHKDVFPQLSPSLSFSVLLL